MTLRRTLLLATAATLASLLTAPAALAQAWPTRAVTLVVSFPPGGDTDALARLFAEKFSARIGQAVNVDNRTGASGTIGNAFAAKAAADGHTLLFTPNTVVTAPLVLRAGSGVQYDVLNDFTPIIQMGSQSLFLVVNSASGIQNIKELISAAKAGKVANYASPGSGSPMHILGEMFNRAAGVKIGQVPYRGVAPAVTDIVGGQVPMLYTTLGPVAPHIASGKLRAIAVADARRSPLAAEVPTLSEQGVSDVELGAWQGLMGPRGLAPDVVRVINGHMNEILKLADVQARMVQLALVPVGGDAAVLRQRIVADNERAPRLIKELGIQAD